MLKIRFDIRCVLLLIVGMGSCWGVASGQEDAPAVPPGFKGKLLVAVSDADMVASAYIDDKLGPAQGEDKLSVVRLQATLGKTSVAQTAVSNSVTGPPAVLTVTRDGRYALVVETLGRRSTGKTIPRLSTLPMGRSIAVVDLSDLDAPKVIQRVACPAQPQSISLNHAGTLAAVAFGPKGAGKTTPLLLYRFQNGRLSLPLPTRIPGWKPGHLVIDAEFAPNDDVLALLDSTAPALVLARVSADGTRVSRWGDTVPLGKAPNFFLARFTPDGRHVLVNSFASARGTIASVRLGQGTNRLSQHRLVSRVTVGYGPEGMAISPDGRWVATANLEQSFYALDDPKQGFFSSLGLIRLDPRTGILTRVGEYTFDGILPETVLFDNSSRYIASTTFDRFDRKSPGGSINFWRIAGSTLDTKRVELIKVGSLPVQRGAHTMVLVR